MFNFKEAFSYLFKEKSWGLKFGIIYVANLIVMVPMSIYSLVQNAKLSTLGNLKTTSLSNLSTNPYWNTSTTSADSSVALLFMCFVLIMIIPFIIVSYWYLYENIQAGIQKRHTKGIWENKFEDTLKKVAKYFVVKLVYGLIIGLVVILIVGIIFGLFCCISMLFTGLASGNYSTNSSRDLNALFGTGFVGMSVVLVCCTVIFTLVLSVFAYLLETPAILRLVGTNTLNEGLKFGENWELAKKHKGTFLTLLGLCIVYAIIIGGITLISTLIAQRVYLSAPAFGILIEIVAQSVFAIATTYFGYFVYTRLLGQAFRGIVKKEASLKHVNIGE